MFTVFSFNEETNVTLFTMFRKQILLNKVCFTYRKVIHWYSLSLTLKVCTYYTCRYTIDTQSHGYDILFTYYGFTFLTYYDANT